MGRTAPGLSASQVGLSVSDTWNTADTWEGLVSLHTHFRGERGWPQGKHIGNNPRGARYKAGGEGTRRVRWHKASALEAGNLRVKGALGQSSRCKGLPEGEAIWETLCQAQRKSAEMRWGRRGGLWERKSCIGKISVLWLLYEAVLAAPKQTVGLAKTHLRQEGRLQRSSAGSWPLFQLFPFRPQPTEKAPGQAQEDLVAGGSQCLE